VAILRSNFSNTSQYALSTEITLVSQNIIDNSSTVRRVTKMIKNSGSGYYSSGGLSGNSSTDNVQRISWNRGYDFRSITELVLENTTYNISHNVDGTKTVQFGAYANESANGFGTVNINSSFSLPTIPRGSIINSSTISTIENEFSCDITSHTGVNRLELLIGNTVIKAVNSYVSGQLTKLTDSEVLVAYNLMTSMSGQAELRLKTFTDSSFTTQIGESSVLSKEISIGGQLNIGTPSSNRKCLVWVGTTSGNKKCNAFIGTPGGNRRGT